MAVDIDKAIATAREVVQRAHKEGRLRQLTNRIVRREVEQLLKLEEGTLAEKEYKKRLNEAVTSTVESCQNDKDDKKGIEETESKTKAEVLNKGPVPSEGSGSAVSKTKPVSTKTEKKKTPKSKSPDKSSGSAEESQREGKAKGNYKSKETIELDDEDMDYTVDIPAVKPVAEGVSAPTKGKRRVDSNDENDDLEDATPTLSKRRKKAEETTSKPKEPRVSTGVKKEKKSSDVAPKTKEPDNASPTLSSNIKDAEAQEGEKSDTELSVLLDGPPTKRGGSSSKIKEKKSKGTTKEKSQGKKVTKELSADEEQIKKLKALVVGCGVRKIWSKELKDCETPSSQIAHLRRMLSDLGMKGRFSMEQAKSIKEKRELAKEMDDVQEFAQKFVGGRSRRSSTAKGKDKTADGQEGEGDEGGDEEDTQESVSRRPRNAHRSIMAFLGDQSDSD
ncbi:hypothetical protein M0805_001393 [Coniferiporia weirii]|nr:hypothetical protein M0805_001393 [Coniferiporia weirii]